jgi:hypothetical protein
MSTTEKIYKIGKHQQLIDLNGDTVNFEIKFSARSENQEHFNIAIVDQNTIDDNPEIVFRDCDDGELSGNIIYNKNIYQNHYIALKTEKPNNITIRIDKKIIPPQNQEQQQQQYQHQQRQQQQPNEQFENDQNTYQQQTPRFNYQNGIISKQNCMFGYKNIIIASIVICGIILLYYLYNKKPTGTFKELIKPTTIESTTIEPTVIEPTVIEPTVIEPTVIEPTTVDTSYNNDKFGKMQMGNNNIGDWDSYHNNEPKYEPTGSNRSNSSLFSRLQNINV